MFRWFNFINKLFQKKSNNFKYFYLINEFHQFTEISKFKTDNSFSYL